MIGSAALTGCHFAEFEPPNSKVASGDCHVGDDYALQRNLWKATRAATSALESHGHHVLATASTSDVVDLLARLLPDVLFSRRFGRTQWVLLADSIPRDRLAAVRAATPGRTPRGLSCSSRSEEETGRHRAR